MTTRKLPPLSLLKEYLDFDQVSGKWAWIKRPGRKIAVSAPVGTIDKDGYVIISLRGYRCFAHRLAWLYVYGEAPLLKIDHINRNPQDNRIANLRLATNRQNRANSKKRTTAPSPYKGVVRVPSGKSHKWRAQIGINGKTHYLGWFDTPEDAQLAYVEAAKKMFGEFATVGG